MTRPRPPRATERRHPGSIDLDMMASADLVDLFLAEDAKVPHAVGRSRDQIVAAVDHVERAFRSAGRLIYLGAGTSGRLGVLDASECPPTFGTDPALVRGLIAGGMQALTDAVEGAEDDPEAGAGEVNRLAVTGADVVMGIAASGSTPWVAGGLGAAADAGATTILLTCSEPPAQLDRLVDLVIRIDVGPELVTGSTRLKAGTATKLVLNMITTGALIRLGKTYGNLMVDLQARNAKLHERGERIVMEVLDVERDVARAAIASAGGSVRTAIVMHALDLDRTTAERRLVEVDNRLRRLIGPPPEVGSDG